MALASTVCSASASELCAPACRPSRSVCVQVQLKRRGDDEKYVARVLAIGTECDLALLTGAGARPVQKELLVAVVVRRWPCSAMLWVCPRFTSWLRAGLTGWQQHWGAFTNTPPPAGPPCPPAVDDDAFWEGISPLELGQLPLLQAHTAVLGYPIGGGAQLPQALPLLLSGLSSCHAPQRWHAGFYWDASVFAARRVRGANQKPPSHALPCPAQATAWPSAPAWSAACR